MNAILTGDCLTHLPTLPAGGVDLAFADPPFNIGYEYDVYRDKRAREDYLKWTDRWLAAVDVVSDPVTGVPVCRSSLDPESDGYMPGCVPYNIFGNGVRNPEAADWVNIDSVSYSKVTKEGVRELNKMLPKLRIITRP